ncbi:hypothetical protein [Vagococcus sp. WN89Y]|uniref:hypothetical protein n=1 Tax=Vagococcus sp. WN89Y TaxID=3457258 RepID=UPI003FCDBA53
MAKNKTFSFAHLFGSGVRASDEEDDKKSKKARKAKGRAEEDEDRDDNAEDDDRDDDAEDEDHDDNAEDDNSDTDADEGDDTDPDAEDDDGDDNSDGKSASKARQAERRRCARIFGSKYAAANLPLAASLAFNTGMSSADAVSILKTSGTPAATQTSRRHSLDERMERIGKVRLERDDSSRAQSSKSVLVSKMTSLYNNARGEK